jgi:hypothetical protein
MKADLDREPVVMFTVHHRVEGDLHLPATTRLSDRMNQAKDFLPITNAKIYSLDGQLLYSTGVVMVHKTHVVLLMERHEAV